VLGIGLYGYDWSGDQGTAVSWGEAFTRSHTHGAAVRWDPASQSPWFVYDDERGSHHTVWFENAYSVSAKVQLMRDEGLGGAYFWLYGTEDDLTWPLVAARLGLHQSAQKTG